MNKIEQIKSKLLEAKQAYYNDEPIMSDTEFDILEAEFKKLSPNDGYFNVVGSPIKVTEWKKAKHVIPMTSLNKVNSKEEFKKWMEQVNGQSYVILPKFDGISLEILYRNGKIIDAITRGDGTVGESILPNIIKMKGVPKTIDLKESVCVRGEIIMRQGKFDELNKKLEKLREKPYSNKRNASSGIAKRYDGNESEYLEVICYDILLESHDTFTFEIQKLDFLNKLGFNTYTYQSYSDFLHLNECFETWQNDVRKKIDFDIDGMVISVNELSQQRYLGEVNGNPKGKIAWKFEQEAKATKLIDIEWQCGNNRRITPVAIFKEVNLCGANINKATLHNLDIFKEFNLREDETILVSRKNDVIPYIEKSLIKGEGRKYQVPNQCPSCGGITEQGTYLICPNDNCDALNIGDILKWINSLEIMDISEKTIEKLYDEGLIDDSADLYELTLEKFSKLEGLGEKSFNKFKEQLESKKEIPLEIFIKGLNIDGFGEGIAVKVIEAGFDTLEKILSLTEKDFDGKIEGVKNKIGAKILKGLKFKTDLIHKLLIYIQIKTKENKMKMLTEELTVISGKSFVFTGAIERINKKTGKNYKRSELQKIVSDMGGINHDSVTAKTNYLVQVNKFSSSSKSEKAKKLGTEILGEPEFFDMIGL